MWSKSLNKIRKGVISDWDRNVPLEELVEAIDDSENNISSVERIMKKVRGERGDWTWNKCESIIVTFKGDKLPSFVHLYDRACSMRIRPYVGNVIQCYRCYRYGHLTKYCRRQRMCIVCENEWHGNCDRPEVCVNYGKDHKANNRKCEYYATNKEIKKVMAFDNCGFVQTKEKVSMKRKNAWLNKKEWPLLNEIENKKSKEEGDGMSTEGKAIYIEKERKNNKVENVEKNIRDII